MASAKAQKYACLHKALQIFSNKLEQGDGRERGGPPKELATFSSRFVYWGHFGPHYTASMRPANCTVYSAQ